MLTIKRHLPTEIVPATPLGHGKCSSFWPSPIATEMRAVTIKEGAPSDDRPRYAGVSRGAPQE